MAGDYSYDFSFLASGLRETWQGLRSSVKVKVLASWC